MFPTIKLNIERWKYNPTFELYVSNMGHIRNKSKADIAPKIMENGYVVVYVNGSINGYMLLHRVVMLTWKPTPEAEKLTVDHLDHNKRNNALSNLEWVTIEENLRRAHEDYVGSICPCGCEFIKNLNFQKGKGKDTTKPADPNSKKSQKKARNKEYFDKVAKIKFFQFTCETNYGKSILLGDSFVMTNSTEGFAELKKHLSQNKANAAAYSSIKDKIDAILDGSNRTWHTSVFGITILPVFDEPAAE